MWVGEISSEELFTANRWVASFFAKDCISLSSAFPLLAIGQLVSERKATSDPQQLGNVQINYLGLENVRSLTGELTDFAPRLANSIKSRSKVFEKGDVLYGRLRPELNKVFLANGMASEGLCSGEFIVLTPDPKLVLPRYLRYVLASSYVTALAAKFRAGASLPRMPTSDLLGIKIPVPPLSVQRTLEKRLILVDSEISKLRERLNTLPDETSMALVDMLVNGASEIAFD